MLRRILGYIVTDLALIARRAPSFFNAWHAGYFSDFYRLLILNFIYFFFYIFFSKKSFRIFILVAKSLDPDQARRFVGPELYPNCVQKFQLTSLAGKELIYISIVY